jgi:SOS-response transcriptional repressor LexA
VSKEQNISPERILALRTKLDFTQEQFAKAVGVSRNYVSMLERGAKDVSENSSIGLLFRSMENADGGALHYANVEAESSMVREEPTGGSAGSYRFANKSHTYKIPVLGWAHAGQASNYDELPQSWQRMIPTDCRDAKAFAVSLEGDSMEPMFRDGDMLVLMPSQQIHNGCMAVVRLVSDGVLLRRVEIRGDRLRLVPINPRYEVDEVGMDEVSWVYPVWGRWTQFWK